MGLIDERQKKAIIKAYDFRLKATGVDADNIALENSLLLLDNEEINNFFSDMLHGDKTTIINSLNDLKIPTTGIVKEEATISPATNLTDITRFKRENDNYFKFKDDKDGMTIVKSVDNKPKTLFKNILDNANNLIEFFKTLPKKQGKIIKLTKSSDIDKDRHPKMQTAIVDEIENKFPNNEVIAAMNENIYIIKGNENQDDIVLAGVKENGKRKIKPLIQKKYNKENKFDLNVNQSNQTDNFDLNNTNNNQTNSLGGRQYVLTTNPARHSSEEEIAA